MARNLRHGAFFTLQIISSILVVLINVTYEGPSYNRESALKYVDGIFDTMMQVFKLVEELKYSTSKVTDCIAKDRKRSRRYKDLTVSSRYCETIIFDHSGHRLRVVSLPLVE